MSVEHPLCLSLERGTERFVFVCFGIVFEYTDQDKSPSADYECAVSPQCHSGTNPYSNMFSLPTRHILMLDQDHLASLFDAQGTPFSGPCRDLWRGRCSKYKRGTWNTAFNRAVLLADMCIEMDASVLIQQQMPWRRFFFFAPLNYSGMILLLLFLLLLLCLQGMVVLLL